MRRRGNGHEAVEEAEEEPMIGVLVLVGVGMYSLHALLKLLRVDDSYCETCGQNTRVAYCRNRRCGVE